MSMVSHTAGARFHALIGAPMLSFYDWYADLPVASRKSSVTRPTCPSPVTGGMPRT
jgi:nitrate reductase alpha subunit